MKSRFIVLAALLSILLSACALSLGEDITPPPDYQSPTPAPTMSPLFPQTPPDLASGAAIFAEKCAPCHGQAGLGDGPMAAKLQKPPAAIGKPEAGRAAAPANWYTIVTEGNINSFMPPFKDGLSDQQRWDVVAYALALGGSTAPEAKKGQSVYEAQCLQCHGPAGNTPPNANLADQALMAKLTQNDIANFVNKGVGTMPGIGGLIPEAEIYAVAAYVRSFTLSTAQVAAVAPTATSVPATATAVPATATANLSVTPQTTTSASVDVTGTPNGTPVTVVATSTPAATPTPAVTGTPTQLVGSIGGKVTNASTGTIPSMLKVILHVFEHDTATQKFSEIATQEAPLTAGGAYSFEKIPLIANRAFYVTVNYAGADYQSEPAFPKDGQTTFDLPLTIYETTTDASALVADQVHIILDYTHPNLVQIVEFYIITNPGKLTVTSAEKGGPVVSVKLPQGYTNLQFEQGAIGVRYVALPDGFADTTSVSPGMKQYQIVFAIELPLPKPGLFGGQKLQLAQILPVKAKSVSVLVPKGVTIEGTNITDGGTQDMGNGAALYQVFNVGAFEPGQTLNVTASGAPSSVVPAASGNNTTQNIIIGIGAFGLVLIVAGGWLFWRDRQQTANEEDEEDDDDEDDSPTQDGIMDAIVALDDQLKSGNISDEAYKERRAELKAKLKGLL